MDGLPGLTQVHVWIEGISAPGLVPGSQKVLMCKKKIVLAIFSCFSHLHFCPEASETAFFHPLDVSVTLLLWCIARCWENFGCFGMRDSGRAFSCGWYATLGKRRGTGLIECGHAAAFGTLLTRLIKSKTSW